MSLIDESKGSGANSPRSRDPFDRKASFLCNLPHPADSGHHSDKVAKSLPDWVAFFQEGGRFSLMLSEQHRLFPAGLGKHSLSSLIYLLLDDLSMAGEFNLSFACSLPDPLWRRHFITELLSCPFQLITPWHG